LPERLAHAVARIRPHRLADADAAAARIEADGVVRRREHDALDPAAVRRLEQVVAADDVGLQDRVPGPFDRMAAEMHDALHALDRALDLGHHREIGLDESLVGGERGRRHPIAPTDVRIDALEQAAKMCADAAGGARYQNCLHADPPKMSTGY